MKAILVVLALTGLISGNVSAQQSLSVVIKNVKEAKGKISIALYNSEDGFMEKSVADKTTVAASGEVQFVFENLVPGDYAISVMHDANDNSKLDSNAFGIPQEGFGFSNDAMGMFGPPAFKKAKFSFSGKSQIAITLKYM